MADSLNIAVEFPKEMLEEIKVRTRDLQFHDVQFYVRWLIAKDVAPKSDAANLELALVYEGMNSGDAIPFDDKFKRDFVERTDQMLRDKASARASRAAG